MVAPLGSRQLIDPADGAGAAAAGGRGAISACCRGGIGAGVAGRLTGGDVGRDVATDGAEGGDGRATIAGGAGATGLTLATSGGRVGIDAGGGAAWPRSVRRSIRLCARAANSPLGKRRR